MTVGESREAFKEEVGEVSVKQLEKLQQYMMENYDELAEQFTEVFKDHCQKVIIMQESGIKNVLACIQFSLMRYKLVNGIYEFRIDAYDENWYGDQIECVATYDVTSIFSFLSEFSNELIERRRKYMQRVTVCDVKRYVLEESDKYKLAVTELIRSALPQAIKLSEYESVKREDLFIITVGEFRDHSGIVHKEDQTEKDVEKVKKLLGTDKEDGHQYEIFDGIDLSDGQFSEVRWLYCSGVESVFINTKISNSLLMFCKFEQAIFESVDFSNSDLVSLDFTGTTLKNIDFTGTQMFQMNFEGAVLENIDFTKADRIDGINLENATLINVILPEDMEVV